MSGLFESTRIADLILAVLLLEGVVLGLLARAGRGPAPRAFLPFLGAGVCLVLALRAVLAGADWPWLAGALLGALVLHGADLLLRWREPPG